MATQNNSGVRNGSPMKELQTQLNSMGANLRVDGAWGPLTQAAYDRYIGNSSSNSSGSSSSSSSSSSSGGSSGVRTGNARPGAVEAVQAGTGAFADILPYGDARNVDRGFTGYRPVTATNSNNSSGGTITHTGLEKGNTVFTPSSGNSNVGYLQHRNGYVGNATYDPVRDRYYTDYGALIREDDHIYTPGARISPNGMYQDVGNGWQSANHATVAGGNSRGGQGFRMAVAGDVSGMSPGQRLTWFDDYANSGLGGSSVVFDPVVDTGSNTSSGGISMEDVASIFDEYSRDRGLQIDYDDLINDIIRLLPTSANATRLKALADERAGVRGY